MYNIILLYLIAILVLALTMFGARKISPLLNLVTFPLTALLMLFLGAVSLGKPIPIQLLLGRTLVINSIMYQQKVAIYVIGTDRDNPGEPIVVRLPWTDEKAKQAAQMKSAYGELELEISPTNGSKFKPHHQEVPKE